MGNRGRILRLPSTNMIPLPFLLLLLLIVVMNPAIVVSQVRTTVLSPLSELYFFLSFLVGGDFFFSLS